MGSTASEEKSLELTIFIFLTVFLAPLLSVLLVSGLGFAIWFSQIMTGPPGLVNARKINKYKLSNIQ